MTMAMAVRGQGESLRIQDTPNFPLNPVSPNRMEIATLGASAGFVLGGTAIVGLYRRQRRLLA